MIRTNKNEKHAQKPLNSLFAEEAQSAPKVKKPQTGTRHTHKKNENLKFPFSYRSWVPNVEIDQNNPSYIRVVTYNILCDSLLPISTQIQESSVEELTHLHWKNRRQTILNELIQLNGDIVCIQEFERDEDMIGEFFKLGYDCAFKPRTGDHSEGCAILWKISKFTIENLFCIELNMNKSPRDVNLIYDRDNICLYAVLKVNSQPDTCFIVANSHLLFNNRRGDIKLGQTYQILSNLDNLQKCYADLYKKIRLVFCGDLNSVPNSGVYKLITEGSVDCNTIDKSKISGQGRTSLEHVDPKKLKPSLLENVTSKFSEKKVSGARSYENEGWFNDIIKIQGVLDSQSSTIQLAYKQDFVHQATNLILKVPISMKSAYSDMAKNIMAYLKDQNGEMKTTPPFNLLQDPEVIDSIEVNAIKMGYAEIDKTLSFASNLTLEPPMSFYAKESLGTYDYIFYSGDMIPVRILNIPDIGNIVYDTGFLPTVDFPSDHISLCSDFFLY